MIRQGREKFYAEAVDLTKVEEVTVDGAHGTLLAERDVTDPETKRLAHAFLSDLAGTRRQAQEESSKMLIHKFMELIFNKAVKKVLDQPFETYYVVSISNRDENEIDLPNIYSLLRNVDRDSVVKEINNACQDLGIEVSNLKPEKLGTSSYYIPVSISFKK